MLVLQLETDEVHAMGGSESGEAILSISLMRAVHVLVLRIPRAGVRNTRDQLHPFH
jgi:hypothetical protein